MQFTPKNAVMTAVFITLLSLTVFPQKQVMLEAKLVSAEVSGGATFGNAIDIDGDTAVVGAFGDYIGQERAQGSVHVFVKREGAWINQARILAADGVKTDYFGQSVAIDGDTIVVGAPQKYVNKKRYQGAVYVFTRTGNNWSKQEKLVAADGDQIDMFGSSVTISGNTLLIGAAGADPFPKDQLRGAHGAVYVYEKVGDNWVEKQKLFGEKTTGSFGMNVAIENKTAVITSATELGSDHGIYIFTNSGSGWKLEHKIARGRGDIDKPNGGVGTQNIGISGNTIVIGGTLADGSGAAFVFTRTAGKWVEQAKLTGGENAKEKMYAWAVDISGNIAVVGAAFGNEFKGTAFVFERNLGTGKPVWKLIEQLSVLESLAFDQFGGSVAIDGKQILVAADNHDLKGRNTNEGAAYVYGVGSDSSVRGPAGATASSSERNGDRFINLVLGARKNGYTATSRDGKTLLGFTGVEHPVTKKPLKGKFTVSYGCEKPAAIQTSEVTWSANRRATVTLSCSSVFEPKVLIP